MSQFQDHVLIASYPKPKGKKIKPSLYQISVYSRL